MLEVLSRDATFKAKCERKLRIIDLKKIFWSVCEGVEKNWSVRKKMLIRLILIF